MRTYHLQQSLHCLQQVEAQAYQHKFQVTLGRQTSNLYFPALIEKQKPTTFFFSLLRVIGVILFVFTSNCCRILSQLWSLDRDFGPWFMDGEGSGLQNVIQVCFSQNTILPFYLLRNL